MLPELLGASHRPRDSPDHPGRSGREQLLCSSNGNRTKARLARVCMAAVTHPPTPAPLLLPANGTFGHWGLHQLRNKCNKKVLLPLKG